MKLQQLHRSRTIVRLERKALEKGHVTGRIMGSSRRLVAVAVVAPGTRIDGFNVFRRVDLSKLVVDPYADFVGEALRLRGDKFPRVRPNLASWRALVGWACLRYPLVTIHIEERRRGVCYIGVPTRMSSKALTLATIDPGAIWDGDSETFAWADVTQVGFGGSYEDALYTVSRERQR